MELPSSKAYGVDLEDETASRTVGEKLGTEVGIQMAENCPGFIRLMAEAEQISNEPDEIQTITRIFVEEKGNELVYLIVEDEFGDMLSFLLLRPFEGASDWIADFSAIKGRRLQIEWEKIEIYDPASKSYKKVKELQP